MRVCYRIVEREIIDRSGINGIEWHSVVQKHRKVCMKRIGGGLHHLSAVIIPHDDIRSDRS